MKYKINTTKLSDLLPVKEHIDIKSQSILVCILDLFSCLIAIIYWIDIVCREFTSSLPTLALSHF